MGGDLGPAMAARLVSAVRARAPRTHEEAEEAVIEAALPAMSERPRQLDLGGSPACILFYGIHGAGKKENIGKLAHPPPVGGPSPPGLPADTVPAAGNPP